MEEIEIPQHAVASFFSEGPAEGLSLMQRIQHLEVTPEERQRYWDRLCALLRQWWEDVKAAFQRFADAVAEAFRPFVQLLDDWAKRLWQRAYPKAAKLRRFPPLPDKRAWQHSQKRRGQIRRERRVAAKIRTALFYRYQPAR